MISREEFFKKYKVNEESFNRNELDWDILSEIYKDYLGIYHTLETVSLTITAILRENIYVHSVRSRIKDPEHLLEKIIRKTIEKREELHMEDYEITKENYTKKITDLIGIRVLHLYKEQAVYIDKMIRDNWEPDEKTTVYKRDGDKDIKYVEENSNLFDPKVHPAGYRSWHYLIKQNVTKLETITEVQVRTIFEEGWSEIDHQLRYPYQLDNELLHNQLMVLNRLAGSADEMVDSIINTIENMDKLEKEKNNQENIIAELKRNIEELSESRSIQEKDMASLNEKINRLEESQRRSFNSNLNGTMDIRQLNNLVSLSGTVNLGNLTDASRIVTNASINTANLTEAGRLASNTIQNIKFKNFNNG